MLAGESKWANGGGRNDAGTETSGYQYVGRTIRSESAPTHDPKTCDRAGNGGETDETEWRVIFRTVRLRLAEGKEASFRCNSSGNCKSFKSFQHKDFNSRLTEILSRKLNEYIAFHSAVSIMTPVSYATGTTNRNRKRIRYTPAIHGRS